MYKILITTTYYGASVHTLVVEFASPDMAKEAVEMINMMSTLDHVDQYAKCLFIGGIDQGCPEFSGVDLS